MDVVFVLAVGSVFFLLTNGNTIDAFITKCRRGGCTEEKLCNETAKFIQKSANAHVPGPPLNVCVEKHESRPELRFTSQSPSRVKALKAMQMYSQTSLGHARTFPPVRFPT